MKAMIISMGLVILLSGCVTAQQDRAATRGAAAGAVAGAVIGAPEGKAAEGAIWGSMIGAAAGVVMASERPRYQRARHNDSFDDEAYLRRYGHDD